MRSMYVIYILHVYIIFYFLTGPGGTPRPIELHSHDPLRYVGDILAWLHQACASENEHITSLLRLCTKEGRTPTENIVRLKVYIFCIWEFRSWNQNTGLLYMILFY